MARHVSSQSLSIHPSGIIRGGEIDYTFHPATGELHYSGHVVIRRFWFKCRHNFTGKLQLDPRVMISDNVKPQRIFVKSLIIQIVKVAKDVAHCTLQLAGSYPGIGAGVLDLTDEVVKLDWVTGEGSLRRCSIFGRERVRLNVRRRGH